MPHYHNLSKEKINELVRNLIVKTSSDIDLYEPSDVTGNGKYFCPIHVQKIINTFPPVWTFDPKYYLLKIDSPDSLLIGGKGKLFITGNIMKEGFLEYFLGNVSFSENCKSISMV